jgi:hypothetical protein
MANLIERVNEYFRVQKISPNTFSKFKCPHKEPCKRSARAGSGRPFICGREPFISVGYEKRTLPRLLVLSADWGASRNESPSDRRAKAIRRWHNDENCKAAEGSRTSHWRELHQIALVLLQRFKPDLKLEEAHQFFAYSNSVKCCANRKHREQASQLMFENCRKYIGLEIELLAPDILVTQGSKAAEAVEKHFAGYVKVLHRISKDGSWFSAVIEKGERKVLWLRTRHPGARPQQSGVNLDKRYAQCARELGEFPMPI